MITKKEFSCLRGLIDSENQLMYRLWECEKQACEPQLKEEFQKLSAAVANQKYKLIKALEGKNE